MIVNFFQKARPKILDGLFIYTFERIAYFWSNKTKAMLHNDVTYDLSYLQSISNNDQAFINDMILTFTQDTPAYLEDIYRYNEEKDYFRLYKTVHKFAPTLIFVGANNKNAALDQLEYFAKEEIQHAEITKLISEITDYCNQIIDQLKETLNNLEK